MMNTSPVPLGSHSAPSNGANLNKALIGATLVAALGGLLFGFDTVVISGVQQQLKVLFELNGFYQGFMTSSALIGTIIGSLIAAKPGDQYGRRDSLKVAGVLYLVCAVGCAASWNFWSLIAFRFTGGIAVGASSVLGPLYLAEISPTRWRGRLVAFFQFNVVLGVLLAFLSNYLVGLMDLGPAEWRWKLGMQIIPAALFLVLLFFIPRSPRWLVLKGLYDEAAAVLRLIGAENVEDQVLVIRASIHEELKGHAQPLFCRANLKPIFLAWAVAMFNQLDGINALMYYMNSIFAMAGFNKVSGDLQAVAIGVANLLATLFGMMVIDWVGRRPLLLWGAIGCGSCLAGVAWVFNGTQHHGLMIWLLVGYIICHAFGEGAVIWVYISEVFPNAVRAKGQTLGSFTHWFMAMVVSWTFPIFAKNAGEPGAGYPFMFFAIMMIVEIVIVWFLFPETKRVALEDMERELKGENMAV